MKAWRRNTFRPWFNDKEPASSCPLHVLHELANIKSILWMQKLRCWRYFWVRLKGQCSGSASYLFYFALVSLFYSQLYLHFTSHHPQVGGFVLSHLLIRQPWRAVGASPFLKVLSWRYEQRRINMQIWADHNNRWRQCCYWASQAKLQLVTRLEALTHSGPCRYRKGPMKSAVWTFQL